EIDIEMKDLSADVGIGDFHRSRVLGVDPIVGPMLADIVQDQL
ncbi:MAG TPA: ferrochelatase, partial [Acidimicrobiaceae bacterium]|nr:ferrochelatase [Acidimicrobiaceae bacterium]